MFFNRAKPTAGNSFSPEELSRLQKALEEIRDELDTNKLKLSSIARKMAPEAGSGMKIARQSVMLMGLTGRSPTSAELINLAELILEPVNSSKLASLFDAVDNICVHIEKAVVPSPSDETKAILIDDLSFFRDGENIQGFDKVRRSCLSSFTEDHQELAKRYVDNIEGLYHRVVALYRETLDRVVEPDMDAAFAPAHK